MQSLQGGGSRRGKGHCRRSARQKGLTMLVTILIVILILMLIGALPSWDHAADWGWGPSGGIGLILIILLILLLTGRT